MPGLFISISNQINPSLYHPGLAGMVQLAFLYTNSFNTGTFPVELYKFIGLPGKVQASAEDNVLL